MASCSGAAAARDESFDRFFFFVEDCIHVRGDLVYVRPQGQKGPSRSQTHIYILEKKENIHDVKKIKSATFGGPFLRSGRLESQNCEARRLESQICNFLHMMWCCNCNR
jgi:hypothetical protein